MEETEERRQLAKGEQAFGMMEIFSGDFYEVWPHGVQCKPSTFLPCEHFSKSYITQNALGRGLRSHKGQLGSNEVLIMASEGVQDMSRDLPREASDVCVK